MSKITDYSSLSAVDNADVIPVVDVSDTSVSPDGTLKQATVDGLTTGMTASMSVGWFTVGNTSVGWYDYAVPSTAYWVELFLCSGGGGGGSGRRGPDATSHVACGGGGGGGACLAYFRLLVADLPSLNLQVQVGTGGTGGAAQTVDSTDGVAGTGGGQTIVRDSNGIYISQTYVTGGGGGGKINSGTGGFTEANAFNSNGVVGQAASTTGLAASGTNVTGSAGQGAAGGGISGSTPVASLGGQGSWCVMGTEHWDTSIWGPAPSNGVIDTVPPVGPTGMPYRGQCGPGSSGGWSSVTGAAAAGVSGLFGAGGGGGGASLNGHTSGAGGNGGDGFALLIPHFG